MATVQDVMKADGVKVNRNMGPKDLVNAWGKLSAATKALIIAAVPGLEAAISALDAAFSALQQARQYYVTAKKATSTAIEVKTKLTDAYTASKASGEGNPAPAAQVAAVTSLESADLAAKQAEESAQSAMNSAASSIKNQLLTTQIPGT